MVAFALWTTSVFLLFVLLKVRSMRPKDSFAFGVYKSLIEFMAPVVVGLTLVLLAQLLLQLLQPRIGELNSIREIENQLRHMRQMSRKDVWWLFWLEPPKLAELTAGIVLLCGALIWPWLATRKLLSRFAKASRALSFIWGVLLVFCSFTFFGGATGVTRTDLAAKLIALKRQADGLLRDTYTQCDRIARESATAEVLGTHDGNWPPPPILPDERRSDDGGPNGGGPSPNSGPAVRQLLQTAFRLTTEMEAAEKLELEPVGQKIRDFREESFRPIYLARKSFSQASPEITVPAIPDPPLSVQEMGNVASVLNGEQPLGAVLYAKDLEDVVDRTTETVYEQSLKRLLDVPSNLVSKAVDLYPMGELIRGLLDQLVQTPVKEKVKQIGRDPFARVTARTLEAPKVREWIGSRIREEMGAALRANIDETVLPVIITEQGENRNRCEEQRNLFGFSYGLACRGT
jgi:hypothetical protein